MRFGSTAKVLLKCKLKYYRISEWAVAATRPIYFGLFVFFFPAGDAGLLRWGHAQ